MELKFNTLLVLVGTLIVAPTLIQAASRSNEKLLKFYPISRQQYMSILKLSRQQPTVSEARVLQHHRLLANWSSTLHNSWNSLFNYTSPNTNGEVINGYPICVLRTDELTTRRKRGARQYGEDYNYSGLVPNVVYNAYPGYSYYDRPSYDSRPPPHQGPPFDNDGEADIEDAEVEEEEEENNDNTVDEMEVTEESDLNVNSPVVNCVVVIKNNKKTKTTSSAATEETKEEYTKPAYGYPSYAPYPYYPYRPPQIPSYGYPAYGPSNQMPPPPPPPGAHYPYPPPYGYSHRYESEITPKSRHNHIQSEYSSINPAADAHYQQMLNEYNHHLNNLYKADAVNPSS